MKQRAPMGTIAKILTIGSSAGIVLSKDILARLKVEKGDSLFISETPDGIKLTPYSPSLAHKLDALETVMRENRDVLRKLAK
jgi:putative addiction module antidote